MGLDGVVVFVERVLIHILVDVREEVKHFHKVGVVERQKFDMTASTPRSVVGGFNQHLAVRKHLALVYYADSLWVTLTLVAHYLHLTAMQQDAIC